MSAPSQFGQETMANSMPVVWASGQTPVANPLSILTGQVTVTTTATALPSHTIVRSITITATASNTGKIYVGASDVTTSTGYALAAGNSVTIAVQNTNVIYILGQNTSDTLSWIAN